jgi:hypothetical protein
MLYAFLNESAQSGSGITEHEIESLSLALQIVSRQEGRDRAGSRRSVWLAFDRSAAIDRHELRY